MFQKNLNTDIRFSLVKIYHLEKTLTELLTGDYIYVLDKNDAIERYKLEREHYSSYLKLGKKEQIHYCHTRLALSEQYYKTASLYEQKNAMAFAIKYHLKAILEGRLDALFDIPSSDEAPKSTADNPFETGMRYLLGLQYPRNYQKAYEYFSGVEESQKTYAQFLLGLMCYYGLGTPRDCSKAKEFFSSIKTSNLPVAMQYLGLCELEEAKYAKAKSHLKPAVKKGLPLAQRATGLLYRDGHGMLFSHPCKAKKLLRLWQEQEMYEKERQQRFR